MDQPPFPKDHQLNDQLQLVNIYTHTLLLCTPNSYNTLPGQPQIRLDNDNTELYSYLEKELLLPQLHKLAPILWLVYFIIRVKC